MIDDGSVSGSIVNVRRDSKYFELHDAQRVHPKLAGIFRKLEKRETGSFIDWAWIDRHLVSRKFDVFRYADILRPPQLQQEIYDSGSGATRAQSFQSYHQWGLAVDLVLTKYGFETALVDGQKMDFSKPGAWLRTGIPQFLESQGLNWGGRWTGFWDVTHFELRERVPRDNAFYGSPWWNLNPERINIASKAPGGASNQAWVVVAALGGAYWLLKGRA